jgi:hypothetical protein
MKWIKRIVNVFLVLLLVCGFAQETDEGQTLDKAGSDKTVLVVMPERNAQRLTDITAKSIPMQVITSEKDMPAIENRMHLIFCSALLLVSGCGMGIVGHTIYNIYKKKKIKTLKKRLPS